MAARKIMPHDTLLVRNPTIAKELLHDDPAKVHWGSRSERLWRCSSCDRVFSAIVWTRTKAAYGCTGCSGVALVPGKTDLASSFPLIAQDYSRANTVPASAIHRGSNEKVKWECSSCGYTWSAEVFKRTRDGIGCASCAGRKLLKGFNDLATLYPEALKEYSPRNRLTPEEILPKSAKKLWWQCSTCSYEWLVSPFRKVYFKPTGCPECARRTPYQVSSGERQVAEFLEKVGHKILRNDRSLITPYEIDIVLPNKFIAIEYNGIYWHSDDSFPQKKPSLKHHTKKELAHAKGYHLFFLWEDDWLNNTSLMQKLLLQAIEAPTKASPLLNKTVYTKKKENRHGDTRK